MRKILFLALHLGYGGVEKAIISEANMLIEQYDVEIACAYKLYEEPAFALDSRVKVHYLSEVMKPNKEELKQAFHDKKIFKFFKECIKSIKVLRYRKTSMRDAIKTSDADVIISSRYLFNALLGKYKRAGVITIAQEHNHHNNDIVYIKKIVNSVKSIDYFMPVSQELTDFYEKKMRHTKCVYVPHSLEFIPDRCSPLEEPILISIGRLSKEKGHLDLVEIFAKLVQLYPQWQLHIVGDGDERQNIEKAIEQNGLGDKVVLHGYQGKKYINRLLERSSIYVMTSFSESFGIVLIEAQSFGLPCIAYDSARGATEIISVNKNGYLISNRNQDCMCEYLGSLMESHKLRKQLGENGRKNAMRYAASNVQKQWFDFLESIQNRK